MVIDLRRPAGRRPLERRVGRRRIRLRRYAHGLAGRRAAGRRRRATGSRRAARCARERVRAAAAGAGERRPSRVRPPWPRPGPCRGRARPGPGPVTPARRRRRLRPVTARRDRHRGDRAGLGGVRRADRWPFGQPPDRRSSRPSPCSPATGPRSRSRRTTRRSAQLGKARAAVQARQKAEARRSWRPIDLGAIARPTTRRPSSSRSMRSRRRPER